MRVWLALAFMILFAAPVFADDAPAGFVVHAAPKDVPRIDFQDGTGQPRTLADFRGKVVLLNLWATWCGPCRHEMPTLDRLQAKLGDPGFEVVALSIDRGGREVVRKFFNEVGVKHLAVYIDPTARASQALKAIGLPVTLLLDREGRELGRLIGPAEWDTPEMIGFFSSVIAKYTKMIAPQSPRLGVRSSDQLFPLQKMPSITVFREHGQ